MSKQRDILRRIKRKAESIKEDSALAYLQRPMFTLSGNRELIAQGSISVEKYTQEKIVLTVSGMTVSADGRNLVMNFYNKNTVKLSGYITALNFDEV